MDTLVTKLNNRYVIAVMVALFLWSFVRGLSRR
jgi:hypothetical protein